MFLMHFLVVVLLIFYVHYIWYFIYKTSMFVQSYVPFLYILPHYFCLLLFPVMQLQLCPFHRLQRFVPFLWPVHCCLQLCLLLFPVMQLPFPCFSFSMTCDRLSSANFHSLTIIGLGILSITKWLGPGLYLQASIPGNMSRTGINFSILYAQFLSLSLSRSLSPSLSYYSIWKWNKINNRYNIYEIFLFH